MKKRTSQFWLIPRENLAAITKNSSSIAEIIRKCEMISTGGSYKTVKERLSEEGIDYSHISLGIDSNKNRNFFRKKIPLEKILVKGSQYSTTKLKNRLVTELGWEEKCLDCGNRGTWQKKKLVLQLDHINGDSRDNRIENLRFLCPNCHSQTETFSGKSKLKNKCKICSCKVNDKSTKHCQKCFFEKIMPEISFNQRKVERPCREIIIQEVESMGYCATGRKYGVSDNAIRKWLK
jgi:hypothetical protein